jgi:acyl-CoA thioester hydrolase
MDSKNFKHKIKEIVKFHEVDMLGVCNNAVYFNYFEDARVKYIQDLKKQYNLISLLEDESFFIMVNNWCDYLKTSTLDDELDVLTRVNFIKNSSFGFEHLVINNINGEIIAKGGGVVVHINKFNKKSIALPKEFYDAVSDYEFEVNIIEN